MTLWLGDTPNLNRDNKPVFAYFADRRQPKHDISNQGHLFQPITPKKHPNIAAPLSSWRQLPRLNRLYQTLSSHGLPWWLRRASLSVTWFPANTRHSSISKSKTLFPFGRFQQEVGSPIFRDKLQSWSVGTHQFHPTMFPSEPVSAQWNIARCPHR